MRQDQSGEDPHCQLDKAGQQGDEGVSHSLQRRTVDMQTVENVEKGSHHVEEVASIGGYLLGIRACLVYKKPYEDASEKKHKRADYQGGEDCHGSAFPDAFLDPFVFSGAQVLTGVGGDGEAEGDGSDFQKPVQFIGSGEARHKDNAEAVDNGLEDHAADADDDILEGNGASKAEKCSDESGAGLEISSGESQGGCLPDVVGTEDAGDQLGNEGCSGSSWNSPSKAGNEEDVQHDVHHRGDPHGDQRSTSVPDSSQDAGKPVVGHDDGNAGEHDADVKQGIPYDLFPGTHQFQNRAGKGEKESCDHQGGKEGEH